MAEIEITEGAKHAIGILFQEALKDKLTQEHGKDTGIGQASIRYAIKNNEIVFYMEDYMKYVEYGTPPHFPPPDELVGWIKRKWGAKDDKEAKAKAFLLAKHIAKWGTRPFPFIRTTLKNDFPKILKDVLDGGKAKFKEDSKPKK